QQPLDVHLATPLGPGLRIELAGATENADPDGQDNLPAAEPAADGQKRHPSAIHQKELWHKNISNTYSSPAYQHLPAHHARLDFPGGDFATAVHILVPIRS